MAKQAIVVSAFGVLALLTVGVHPSAQAPARSAPTRTAYASVIGKDDTPVAGLAAADFTVREDGKPREVLSVKPGGAPAHIAILIDDSQALNDANAVQDYRAALSTFVKDILATSPTTEIALIGFADRPTQLLDYTSSAIALQKAVDKIFGQPNSGAYMLTAISDACKALKKKSYTDNAIVAFTVESGPEFGSESHQAIEAGLKGAGASLWTIVLQSRATQGVNNQLEERERQIVMGDTAQNSGGMRDMLLTKIGMETHFKALAARLAARYAITYGRPESLVPPEKLEMHDRPQGRARPRVAMGGPMKPARRLAIGAGLALLAAAGLSAPTKVSAQQTPSQIFRAGTDVVSLSVTVATPDGKLIGGLDQALFQVFEDGALQDIKFFSSDRQPIALSILLDSSQSMEPKLDVAQEAASGFAHRLGAQDLAEVIDFDSRVEVLQDFTNDVTKLDHAIRKTRAGGSTSLHNAIYIALSNLKKARLQPADSVIRHQAIVVLSDGEDTSSLMGYDEVLDLAKRSDVIVYAIGLKSPQDLKVKGFSEADYELRTLSEETGGRFFTVEQTPQLAPIYQQIADELMNQYTIGYTSKNPKKDGAWRTVQVRVQQPNAIARTKRGYYGPTMPGLHMRTWDRQ